MTSARMVGLAAFLCFVACGGDDDGGGATNNDGGAAANDAGSSGGDADGAPQGTADASPPVTICDGGDELRLAALYGTGGLVSPAAFTSTANGSQFIYVDGSCRYWTTGVDGQALSGTLDAQGEALLTSQLNLASWPSYRDGDWRGDSVDAPPLILWEPAGRVICSRYCDSPKLPEPLGSIGDRLRAENERLAEGAQPLDGPMRALAIEGPLDSFPTRSPVFDWIYQPAIADFSYREEEGNPVDPALIDDPDAVTALRQAWLEAQEAGDFFLPVRDAEGVTYRLFARDVLPFEAADGYGVDLPE